MTFQEAQNKFQNIVAHVSDRSSPTEIQEVKTDLSSLLRELPNTAEFDPIATAITESQGELSDRATVEIVKSITSRSVALQGASDMLNEVSQQAEGQARQLSLEKSKVVIPTVTKSVQELQKIRDDVKAGRFSDAATKVESLIVLLEQVKNKIT